jgi:hypothetical protein
VAKRGRPAGSNSRMRNPVNVAAHYTNALIETWLADALLVALALLHPLLEREPERVTLLVACFRTRSDELRHTVPVKVKRTLCRLAIAYTVELHLQQQAAKQQIEDSRRRSGDAGELELRRRGWTDERIASWVKKLRAAAQRRSVKDFRAPDVSKVMAIADRKAPPTTLRRKATHRKLRRKMPHRKLRRKMQRT